MHGRPSGDDVRIPVYSLLANLDDFTEGTHTSSVTFGRSTPILRVSDLDASIAYYTGVLRFQLDWRDRGFAQVARGDAPLMLCQGLQGHLGGWVYAV